jgi:hypothetical protein
MRKLSSGIKGESRSADLAEILDQVCKVPCLEFATPWVSARSEGGYQMMYNGFLTPDEAISASV